MRYRMTETSHAGPLYRHGLDWVVYDILTGELVAGFGNEEDAETFVATKNQASNQDHKQGVEHADTTEGTPQGNQG